MESGPSGGSGFVVGRVPENMCMGPGLTHVKGLGCFGGQDKIRRIGIRDRGRGQGPGEYTSGSISFTESLVKKQAILVEKFSKSNELEELHKHQSREEGEYDRFHVAKSKTKEEAAVTGTTMPDDLALMAIVAGGVRRGCVYRAGSEAVHLRAESSRAPYFRGLASIGP
ncbi:hypothetical protein M9H77_22479 [Catharanthus roseus]|uniref:Uncharacterized protein n=1 Tax=Catharanthus roseus TaxID=4058 RepID=A0ACC0ARA8_CATRO|nr:hypothetical protein M9H77_22479 [Catharanthus roseus]